MANFFTAGTHFADDPVRGFFGRPFSPTEAMDEAMIDRAHIVGGMMIYGSLGTLPLAEPRLNEWLAHSLKLRFVVMTTLVRS